MNSQVATENSVKTEETRFSARLKAETAARHDNAENSGFMTKLMKGELSTDSYVRLLNQYVYIYAALEEVAAYYRQTPNGITAPFNQEGLDRLTRIKEDLKALGQDELAPALPATEEYAQLILATKNSPERFIAHHYLRYLGDLSGGQAVAALVARYYGIGAEALSMYRFDELPKPKIFKDSYRQLLDTAPMSQEEQDALIDEALLGFDLNAKMFGQLAELEPELLAA